MRTRRERLFARLQTPVDGASLAAFRILFGLLMCAGNIRFLFSGWIPRFFEKPTFFFHYWGFSWLEVPPVEVVYAIHVALAVLGLLIALGLFYRVSALLFTLGFTFVELLDVTNYLNHYYLVSLLGALMVVAPLHRTWSLDARRKPELASGTVPTWALYLFRFQIGVVYFYAGMAKVQSDWLLHAQPLNLWFTARTETPVIGPWLSELWVAYGASWAAAFYDLTIPFWLSWKRSRPFAYVALLGFHTLTAVFFNIGMFPYIMTLAATVFFAPDWPRRLTGHLRLRRRQSGAEQPPASTAPRFRLRGAAAAALALFCLIQVALPLRHFLYPGDVLWAEDGMRFSWKVMVREKHGSVTYYVRLPSRGVELQVSPRRYLTSRQEREMAGQPDLILQLAHHIADEFRQQGHGDVEVRAEALVSLNGRPAIPMIDSTVDLAAVEPTLAPSFWVTKAPGGPPIQLRARVGDVH